MSLSCVYDHSGIQDTFLLICFLFVVFLTILAFAQVLQCKIVS